MGWSETKLRRLPTNGKLNVHYVKTRFVMKAKSSYSQFFKTNYVTVILGFTGSVAIVCGVTIAWPALSHLASKIV